MASLQMETTGNVDKHVYVKYKQTEKEIAKLEETVRILGEQEGGDAGFIFLRGRIRVLTLMADMLRLFARST
jgi:hypothetical protein